MNHLPDHGFHKLDDRFLGADNTRFWSMVAIVVLHGTCVLLIADPGKLLLLCVVATPFKFATIAFFLISGFLLHKNLQTDPSLSLISKRCRKVFLPWLLWYIVFVSVMSLVDLRAHRLPFSPGTPILTGFLGEMSRCLPATALWFVPNLLFSLAILLLVRRFLDKLWLGAILLAITLFYAADVYTEWLPSAHTRAFFAFIFFLWLGNYAATRVDRLEYLLSRISFPTLITLTLLAALLSFGESLLLLARHASDPLNTLRLSNQIFSLLVVLCLFKLRRPFWPRFVDVPRHTFGIYLSHTLVVVSVLHLVRHLLQMPAMIPIASTPLFLIPLWIVTSAVTWSLGFLVARTLAARPSLAWMVGISRTSPSIRTRLGSLPRRLSATRREKIPAAVFPQISALHPAGTPSSTP